MGQAIGVMSFPALAGGLCSDFSFWKHIFLYVISSNVKK